MTSSMQMNRYLLIMDWRGNDLEGRLNTECKGLDIDLSFKVLILYGHNIENMLKKSNHNRIAKATMCSPIDWGGQAVPDLESKVVVSNLNWIKRIFMDTNCLPSIFLELLLNNGVNIKDFISTKTELNVAQSDDLFYNKVLHDWHDIYNHSLETKAEVRNEILWHNKFITIGCKQIYWKAWVKAGIMRVQDILEGDRFMSEVQISQKYKISCNFMEALQIRKSVPGS